MFILIDCNNFFASCETAFNPKLRKKPLVILSNNDGCIIARSNEAKALNVPMGSPIFKYRDLVEKNVLHVLSSNFSLYADMSQRVMETIESFNLPMEIYSVDEAFLYLSDKIDYISLAIAIKSKIYKWTGINVSVGIAPTKTLAKLAVEFGKKSKGIYLLEDIEYIKNILKKTPVENIWGIGQKSQKKLHSLGVYSAYDLTQIDENLLRKNLSVCMLKTAYELKGIVCFDYDNVAEIQKSICTSRSFTKAIADINELKKHLSTYTAQSAEKLREQKMHTNFINVFLRTSLHKENFYSNCSQLALENPTSYTPELINAAINCLEKIYKKGFFYKKIGIVLSDFTDESTYQQNLFSQSINPKKTNLMKTIDHINCKKKSVFFASENIKFKNSKKNRSQKYTTDWNDLLIVN